MDQNRPGHALAGFGPGTMPDHFGDIFGLSKYVYVGHGPPTHHTDPHPPSIGETGGETRKKQTEQTNGNEGRNTSSAQERIKAWADKPSPKKYQRIKIKRDFSPCVEPPLLQPPLFGFLIKPPEKGFRQELGATRNKFACWRILPHTEPVRPGNTC